MAFEGSADPDRNSATYGRAWRLRADNSGAVWRRGARQDGDVRRQRRAVARLYRRGFAGYAVGDRGGAHSHWRYGGAEGKVAAEDCERGDFADGCVHRAEYGL